MKYRWLDALRNKLSAIFIEIKSIVLGHHRPTVELVRVPDDNDGLDERAGDIEAAGRWYFKRNILDKLDNYFTYLARLKKCDLEAYQLFSSVGGYITNTHAGMYTCYGDEGRLDPAWLAGGVSPSFGMVSFLGDEADERDDGDESYSVRLIYFQKVGRSWRVEPSQHDVYRVVFFCAAPTARFRGLNLDGAFEFHMSVDKDRRLKLLREFCAVQQHLPPTKVSGHLGRQSAKIVKVSWGWPQNLRSLHRGILEERRNDLKNKKMDSETRANFERKLEETPEEFARFIFSIAANWMATASADVHVHLKRNNLHGMFCVDLLRTPYFFSDRETTVAKDGRRKRIFHIVRTHKRDTWRGTSFVKSHFRGEREFRWGNADVRLTMPGKHHKGLGDFGSGFVDEELLNHRKGYLRPRELGEKIRDYFNENAA